MTVLALVRHGETDWNKDGLIQGVTDVPLNATGLGQASLAAESLKLNNGDLEWTGVVTSPLLRALVTGQVIAQELGIPLSEPMPQFAERDYGSMEGVEITRAKDLYPSGEYPDSEHNDAVYERSLAGLNGVRDSHPAGGIVIVAHGGLLHTLMSRLHGSRLPSIRNATVNLVEHDGDRWIVRVVNGEEVATASP